MSVFICLFPLNSIGLLCLSLILIFIAYYFLFVNKNKTIITNNKTKNSNQIKIKHINPIFRNNLIITTEYHCPSLLFKHIYCYEIYKLNSIKNAVYLAFTVTSKDQIKIIKINILDKSMHELISLKYEDFPKKIKYFNDKLGNNEYLFICFSKKMIIYLIKAENKFKKILEYEQKGKVGGRIILTKILPIFDFEIMFNKFDNNIYLIVTFIYSGSCTSEVRDIKILNFKNNKLILMNEIKSSIRFEPFISGLFLIWEDNISQKPYLITNIYNNLKIIDMFNIKSCFISQDNQIDGFNRNLGENGCIIQTKDNDYLYLTDNEGSLTIVNLREKEKIKQIDIKGDHIYFIDNWNEKYIIIGSLKYIYVFNTDINKIMSKYFTGFNTGRIHHMMKFFYEEKNFYSICVGGSDNIIRLFF